MGKRFSAPAHCLVKKNYNRGMASLPSPVCEGDRFQGLDLQCKPKLLPDLPYQRKSRGFIRFHLAPREFPQAAVMLSFRPPIHKEMAIFIEDGGRHYRQPCRIILHFGSQWKPFVSEALREAPHQTVFDGGRQHVKRIKLLKAILDDKSGATAVEYGLIVALVVIAVISAVRSVADESTGLWAVVSDNVQTVMGD